MTEQEPDLGGMTIGDTYRALRHALNEASELALGIRFSNAQAEQEEFGPEGNPEAIARARGAYIRQQLSRIGEQTGDWSNTSTISAIRTSCCGRYAGRR